MKVVFRMTRDLLLAVHRDLSRPHEHASERVGFIFCGVGALPNSGIVIVARSYHKVEDDHYVHDDTVGAVIGEQAFRQILQATYRRPASVFHVHRHEHRGRPVPSLIDTQESAKFVPNFWHVAPKVPHGFLLLSLDNHAGWVWPSPSQSVAPISHFLIAGGRSNNSTEKHS